MFASRSTIAPVQSWSLMRTSTAITSLPQRARQSEVPAARARRVAGLFGGRLRSAPETRPQVSYVPAALRSLKGARSKLLRVVKTRAHRIAAVGQACRQGRRQHVRVLVREMVRS